MPISADNPQLPPPVTIPEPPVIPSSKDLVVIPPGTPNAAFVPVIQAHVEALADTPPGPDAQAKASQLINLLLAIITNPAVASIIPTSWKGWVAYLVAFLTSLSAGGVLGRYVFPSVPTAIVAPLEKDKTPPTVPPAITAQHKLTLYVLGTTDTKALLADAELKKMAVTVSVYPQTFAAGQHVEWGGKSIAIPCGVLDDSTGKTLDVQSFTHAADLAAWVGKSLGK